jgi:glycerol-1-phosphate dehydrogenase [NAD(P)+]
MPDLATNQRRPGSADARPIPDPTDLARLAANIRSADGEGRLHPIGIKAIRIGESALDDVPVLVGDLGRAGPIVVLVDPTPMRRGPDSLKEVVVERLRAIPGADVRLAVIGSDRVELHADDAALAEADAAIAGAGCVVSVGSGTITDIAKDATHRAGDVPLVVIQTAVSVNAFSDDMAVLVRSGVKRTVPSRWPTALVIDLGVIAAAPPDMNRAGFGELASMFTAPVDWYLAGALGMDPAWHPEPVAIFRREGEALLAAAGAVHDHEPTALALLSRLMTLSGMALGVAGKTAPISGTEHIVSHLLDMDAEAAGRSLAFHGAQVGVAAIVVALAWTETLDTFDPSAVDVDACYPSVATVEAEVRAAFDGLDATGAVGDECWHDVERKLARWSAARPTFERFLAAWPRHRAAMRALTVDPAVLAAAIRRAGAPGRFGELTPTVEPALARWALTNCHRMRDRFVLPDLRSACGTWSAADVDRLLDRAAALGAGL